MMRSRLRHQTPQVVAPPGARPYLHGSRPKEQRRLSDLNDLLNEVCLRELALQGNESIIDVGSGLGQFTRAMGRAVKPTGRVLGIERDVNQLAEARQLARAAQEQALVDWRQGDATALPLKKNERGVFDVAHARWVLEHVPEPEKVVRQMVRAVRPGGRIVLADDDHQVLRLWPQPNGFTELWGAYLRAFQHLQCDPFVGRRLLAMLHQAGANPVRNNWIFFGSCAAALEFPAFVSNLLGVISTARRIITGPLAFGAARFDHALDALREWAGHPDAALWYSLCWAEGVRK